MSNVDLRKTIEEKAAHLYWKMKEELTHGDKNFFSSGRQAATETLNTNTVSSFFCIYCCN